MKCLHILYLYMGEVESIVLKVLSTRCSVQLCRAGEENGLQKDGWDLVVLQDAVYCLLQTSFCHKLKNPTIYLKIPSCICLIEKSSVTLHSNKISMLLCQKLL